MKKVQPFLRFVATALIAATPFLSPQSASAQLTQGNVVVLQVGDGSAALTSASTAIFLKEYNTTTAAQAAPVSTITIPITGAARLVTSGSATSEGLITLSSDSSRIVIAGYDTTTAFAGIAGTTSANIARAIDTVSILGIPGRADTTKTAFSGNNIRSATRNNSENYWAAGGNSGTYYMGNLSTPLSVQTAPTNTRFVLAANGNIYCSTGSATIGIYKIPGQPTVATPATMLFATGTASSPYSFAINASETVAYVSDDRAVAANTGGIYKWTLTAGVWSPVDTLRFGTTTPAGTRGIAVDWSGAYPTIYATTTDNRLIRWNDSANFTHYYTVLATAGTNTAFRSVAFTPKCVTPVLATTITNRTCTANGAVSLSITGGTAPTTFSWTGPASFTATTQNISNLAAGTYNITVTTPGGCTATTTATVTNPTFTATATAGGATTICAPDSVTLNANTGTGYTYQWNNASGIIPGATNPTYKAAANGSYTVTVSSGTNCTATSSPAITVTINPLPVVSVVAAPPVGGVTQICGTVTPTATYTYQWRLNGTPITGATSLCINATVTGNYCLYATNATTGCVGFSCTSIVACTPPSAAVTPAGPLAICPGNSVTLHTNNATGLTYQWKNNGTNVSTGGTDSTYVVTAAGSYTVVVTGSCSATSSPVVVTISALPATTVTAISTSPICAGDTIKLKTVSAAGATYGWSVNANTLPAQTDSLLNVRAVNPTGAPVTVGFRAIVTNAAGCKDSSALTNVVINPRPNPAVTVYDSLRFCQGDSVILSVATGTGYVHRWSESGAAIPGAANDSITIMTAGFYRAIITNSYGCTDSSAIHPVVVVPLPAPVAVYSGGVLSTATGMATYQWYLNGVAIGSATSDTYTPTANGSYSVVVTNTGGCSGTSAAVTVSDLSVHGFQANGISIYPNPAQEVVYIKANRTVNVTLKDLQGRVVRDEKRVSQLNIANLAAGVYSINIYTTGGELLLTQKLVKAH